MSQRTRSSDGKAVYSRPNLIVYGGMAKLTASGSVVGMEVGSMTATEKG